MDYDKLVYELDQDPIKNGYAIHVEPAHDMDIADILNAKTRRGSVPIAEISTYCAKYGITGTVRALLELPIGSTISPGVTMSIKLKSLLYTVETLLVSDTRIKEVNVDDTTFLAACDGLVQMGLFQDQNKTEILALADNRVSRAEELFGEPVEAADIEHIRKRLAQG